MCEWFMCAFNLQFYIGMIFIQFLNFVVVCKIGLEGQSAEVKLERPCPSQCRKDLENDALAISIECLTSSLSTTKTDGPTIAKCIASLKEITDVPNRLYVYAFKAFCIKENREISMSEDDDRMCMMSLKTNVDGGFVA